jgi:hypothetical protein
MQLTSDPGLSPLFVLLRLLVALVLGALVAWIYVRTSRRATSGESFPTTLALLAVLIAMVTQVIGDNVARAFSLVGALSIVRFRTVVRDTKDTAYVIFAVVVGMAVGAQNLWVAVIGIAVIGCAMFVSARSSRTPAKEAPGYLLTVRVGPGQSLDQLAGGTLDQHLQSRHLVSMGTMKQATTLEYIFETRLRQGSSPEVFVQAMNLIEGVQDVRLQHRTFEFEP